MNDYNKRLVEVDEILNYLIRKEYMKIPKDVIQAIKDNKDKEYIWKYDKTKELKDQDVSRETISILSYINMEYLLNEEQKQIMKQIHGINEQKAEKNKSEKYNENNLFFKKSEKGLKENKNIEDIKVIIYKENFLHKFLDFFKKIFNK